MGASAKIVLIGLTAIYIQIIRIACRCEANATLKQLKK
ncbi:hypothetical protein M2263_002513 [Providencia alcalifaciens]|nr:hypothetical protein [Providencia alcalifaciens]